MFWKRKQGTADSPTLQDCLRLAGEAVTQAQWTPALAYLAWALEVDPVSPEARALLERILRAARDPLGHVSFTRGAETPYQIGAIRAYIHAWRGQLDEAVVAMAQVYQVVPGLPYLPWLVEWLSPERAVTVEANAMGVLVAALLGKLEAGNVEDCAAVEKLVPALARYAVDHPQAARTYCIVVILRLIRTLGKGDEAFAIAEQACRTSPNQYTAIALSMAYKARGDIQAAVAALRDALGYEPDNLDIRLDIGDILCDIGQIKEGLAAYQEVLVREPRHAWALPSYLYHRALLEPDGPWQHQLGEYVAENPDNVRAHELNTLLQPYVLFLPEPTDATINLLRRSAEEQLEIQKLDLSLSSLESPSARLAVELYQAEHFGKAALTVDVAEIQQPDPRLPRGPVDFVLWRYDGTDPQPTVKPPPQAVADAVAELAARPYHADDWSRQARVIAAGLGKKRAGGLLGVMVHPPRRPPQYPIWIWIQRVQVAAAFIVAHLDDGWEGSVRKRVLFSLARGPLDWTVEAAILALAQVAREEPALALDVGTLYLDLLDSLPGPGGVPYLDALLHCSRHLPTAPEELRARAETMLAEMKSFEMTESFYDLGLSRYEAGDYDEAIANFSKVLELQPDVGEAYYLRGAARAKRGEHAAAIGDYTDAIRLMSQSDELYAIHLDRGVACVRIGDIDGALADYNEAIRLNPQCAAAYVNWGHLLHDQGKLDAAIACYDSALRIDPQSVGAYNGRANVLRDMRDYDGAIADYSEAVCLDPAYAVAFGNRGLTYIDKGDYDKAIVDCDEAIRLDPQCAAAYNHRGIARADLGDHVGAMVDYDEAIRLDPRLALAYHNRGIVRSKQGDYAGAIADYDEAIRLDPQFVAAYNSRSAARKEMGDYAGALADCDEAIRLDPRSAAAYNNRGSVRRVQGDHERAVADYNEAIRIDSCYVSALVNRGIARREAGDPDGAMADYEAAIRIDPRYPNAYHSRGIERSKAGDYAGALADYNEAIRLNPDYAEAHNNRGLAYSRMGDRERALADFDRAIQLDPRDAIAYLNRGSVRGGLGDGEGALADFVEVIRLAPQLPDGYINRGIEYFKREDYERAAADLDMAIHLNARSVLAYANRAAIRCELGDYDGAISDASEALRLDPRQATAYNNRGWAWLKKGDYDRAIDDSSIAIQIRQHGYYYNTRGQARGGKGDYTGAIADLRTALRLAPDHPEAEDIRAKIAEWSDKIK